MQVVQKGIHQNSMGHGWLVSFINRSPQWHIPPHHCSTLNHYKCIAVIRDEYLATSVTSDFTLELQGVLLCEVIIDSAPRQGESDSHSRILSGQRAAEVSRDSIRRNHVTRAVAYDRWQKTLHAIEPVRDEYHRCFQRAELGNGGRSRWLRGGRWGL